MKENEKEPLLEDINEVIERELSNCCSIEEWEKASSFIDIASKINEIFVELLAHRTKDSFIDYELLL